MELEMKIREQLALRSRKRHEELQRQASRFSHAQETQVLTNDNAAKVGGVLDELKAAHSRRGFLTSRLELPTLTLLQRWHAQLQLLEMDNVKGSEGASPSDVGGVSVDAPVSALEKVLHVLNHDKPCFDVVYASAIRLGDLKETLFDASEQQLRANEALAFSSTRSGYTSRVVLFTIDGSGEVEARSSLFVPDLNALVHAAVQENANAAELVECVWEDRP